MINNMDVHLNSLFVRALLVSVFERYVCWGVFCVWAKGLPSAIMRSQALSPAALFSRRSLTLTINEYNLDSELNKRKPYYTLPFICLVSDFALNSKFLSYFLFFSLCLTSNELFGYQFWWSLQFILLLIQTNSFV